MVHPLRYASLATFFAASLCASPALAQHRSHTPSDRGADSGRQGDARTAAPRTDAHAERRYEDAPRRDERVVGRPYFGDRYAGRSYYYRPYYAFRPRLSLGFGLWVGYPVYYPYGLYVSRYDAAGIAPAVNVGLGGISFEISPASASVFADGYFAGRVSDFAPTMAPLGLAPGRHHVEIREPGFDTMAFDVDVVAGQVLPFQGVMDRD